MKNGTMKKTACMLFGSLIAVSLLTGCGEKTEETSDKTSIAFVSYQALDSSEWLQNLVAGLENYEEENEKSDRSHVVL